MKTEMQVQQDNINELVRLQAENPNARVMCFVSEDCNNGEYSYMSSIFGKPRLERMTLWNNYWIDEEDYVEVEIENQLLEINPNLSKEELKKLTKAQFDIVEWEEIIVIYIEAS